MKVLRTILFAILAVLSMQAWADDGPQQKLQELFHNGEQCYLTDDYAQLKLCIDEYVDLYYDNILELGDSADVYEAYLLKMRGNYYYGVSNKENSFRYKTSEHYYNQCFNIFKERDDTENAYVIREELAQLYYKMQDYESAIQQLDKVSSYYEEQVNYMSIKSSEPHYYRTMSQQAICNARLGYFDKALQQIETANQYFAKKKDGDYYETLRRWGKILMMQADKNGSTDYQTAKKCYERYVNEEFSSITQRLDTMSSMHRSQHWLATHRFLYDCCRLGNHAPELIYNLALFSKGFLISYENNRSAPQYKWQQVQKKLTKRDCAIEFVQYFGVDDQKRLGCMVLKSKGKPLFIDLFSTDSLLELRLNNKLSVQKAFNSTDGEIKEELYQDQRFIKLIWTDQLMEAIGNADRVYFSPDGLVHQWAIEYIMPDTTKTCYRLSTTGNLVKRPPNPKMNSALLCGVNHFKATYKPVAKNNDFKAFRYLKAIGCSWRDLTWPKLEVEAIYECRDNPNDTLLVDISDENVLEVLRNHKYDILHFTTHGSFEGKINIQNELRPLPEDINLSRSVLAFAGAETTLRDRTFDDAYSDGMLSGTEIANLDLNNTELVVLNACTTGQGRLTDEGIYGMQRAVKLAGGNTMIVSLWSVHEKSSAYLLQFFYEEIKKQPSDKTDIHSAFITAQDRLKHYNFGSYDSPVHINPFILIDAY